MHADLSVSRCDFTIVLFMHFHSHPSLFFFFHMLLSLSLSLSPSLVLSFQARATSSTALPRTTACRASHRSGAGSISASAPHWRRPSSTTGAAASRNLPPTCHKEVAVSVWG